MADYAEYNWKIGLWKAIKTAGLVVLPIVVQQLANEQTIASLLPPAWAGAAAGLAGLIKFLVNRTKNT